MSARTALFAVTVFVSSALLFVVQPMVAKMVLPLLGGAPAVWNTCMVFFQACLLIGYAYAHFSTGWLRAKPQAVIHVVLMLVAVWFLPLRLPPGWTPPAQTNPVGWLLALLSGSIAVPFIIVSATAPLAQKWFAATAADSHQEPYFLYAASNVGSMLALLSYPVLVEPWLDLHRQSREWFVGYVLLIVLIGAGAVVVALRGRQIEQPDRNHTAAPVTWPQRLWWIVLALVPASYLLSVTSYITSDLAAVPLLWVIPLAIYLLTFILVFSRRPPLPHRAMVILLPIVMVLVVLWLLAQVRQPVWLVLIVHLLGFFVAAMVCHGELVRRRPPAEHLTEFYLMMSLGGVLGGIFNALVAPVIFSTTAEYPLAIVLACGLCPPRPSNKRSPNLLRTLSLDVAMPIIVAIAVVLLLIPLRGRATSQILLLVLAPPVLLGFATRKRPLRFALVIAAALLMSGWIFGGGDQVLAVRRSFFGVHRLVRTMRGPFNELYHGTTLHGRQYIDPATFAPILPREPLTYYHRSGPIGQVMLDLLPAPRQRPRVIGLIGLGTGSLAAYAEAADDMTFYEIDPLVPWLAEQSGGFTFLSDARSRGAHLHVVLGDARLTIRRAADATYDLLVLDAFSGDAIPVHLLTREALQIYLRKIRPGGFLAFHISNQYLDLRPVVANLADDAHCVCVGRLDNDKSQAGKEQSLWLLVMRDISDFAPLAGDARWLQIPRQQGHALWTDEYSDLITLLQWKPRPRVP